MASGGAFAVASRVLLAVLGGYLLSDAAVSLLALALSGGMPRSEAVVLAAMPGFLLYLVLGLWAFSEPRAGRCWLVLGGGALTAQAAVRLLMLTEA